MVGDKVDTVDTVVVDRSDFRFGLVVVVAVVVAGSVVLGCCSVSFGCRTLLLLGLPDFSELVDEARTEIGCLVNLYDFGTFKTVNE
jgi:hypothetical protein